MEKSKNPPVTIGFLLNPIAGMGGKYALKGTDGLEILKKAIKLGATPITPEVTKKFLIEFNKNNLKNINFIVAPSPMGYDIFESFISVNSEKINVNLQTRTNEKDTMEIVKEFCRLNVDLILFVGGDGTSVDICKIVNKKIPILGIPSGVKTYGEVFSHNISEAIEIIKEFSNQQITHMADIIDLDENEYRKGNLNVKVKGQVLVPNFPQFFQQSKSPSFKSLETDQTNKRIANYLLQKITSLENICPILLCPGSTFNHFSNQLNIERSLLGIDIIFKNTLIIKDATEAEIYNYCFNNDSFNLPIIIVTPIGSMGSLFGRGNQQLSPRILKRVPKENIWIVASQEKLNRIQGGVLRVDTKDQEADNHLCGYFKVITDREEYKMVKVIH